MLLLFFAGSGERERLLPSGRMMIIISDATTTKKQEGGGGPGLLSVVNNWNDFPSLGIKKRKSFTYDILQGLYSFLLVILRRLSRLACGCSTILLFYSVAYRFLVFFSSCVSPRIAFLFVCVKMFSVKNETQSRGSH